VPIEIVIATSRRVFCHEVGAPVRYSAGRRRTAVNVRLLEADNNIRPGCDAVATAGTAVVQHRT